MGGASAPLWVTIMLGVLAVVGTVGGAWGGQIIAARRDDKRWEREREREELRWTRERESDEAARKHEMLVQWRDARSRAYAAMYSEFHKWALALNSGRDGSAATPEQMMTLTGFASTAIERIADLALHGSNELLKEAGDLLMLFLMENNNVFEGVSADTDEAYGARMDKRTALLNAMRRDLGVDPVDWPVPALFYKTKRKPG